MKVVQAKKSKKAQITSKIIGLLNKINNIKNGSK